MLTKEISKNKQYGYKEKSAKIVREIKKNTVWLGKSISLTNSASIN